ncbi:MAG: hypothetical protein UEY91_07720 [Lachnospiraceae bacterium]|nr:hypothetical protein [Pseudobutyrivibrio sp.]MEE0106663.1 hypothetical protein [Lachnospiraceae bacterium]
MGFLDFFKKKTVPIQSQVSKYEHLPLINPQEDRNAPGGYVKRKFITEEKIYQQCINIFSGSSIPIVNQCEYANRYLGTLVLQNPNGKKVRSVTEIIYYVVPHNLKQEYLKLVAQLNNPIIEHKVPAKYLVSLDKIVFSPSSNGGYEIPLSYIQYNQEKRELYFIFRNEIMKKGPYKQSIPTYESTEFGSMTFSEDGYMKKAEFTKLINGKEAKVRFKNYKSGFDLYDIRHNGEIIYKRDKK